MNNSEAVTVYEPLINANMGETVPDQTCCWRGRTFCANKCNGRTLLVTLLFGIVASGFTSLTFMWRKVGYPPTNDNFDPLAAVAITILGTACICVFGGMIMMKVRCREKNEPISCRVSEFNCNSRVLLITLFLGTVVGTSAGVGYMCSKVQYPPTKDNFGPLGAGLITMCALYTNCILGIIACCAKTTDEEEILIES
jgi:hypothetical protein